MLSVAEKSLIQALDREPPVLPMMPGMPEGHRYCQGVSPIAGEHIQGTRAAGFGELSWQPSPGLELSAGARLTRSLLALEVILEGIYAGRGIEVAESQSDNRFLTAASA